MSLLLSVDGRHIGGGVAMTGLTGLLAMSDEVFQVLNGRHDRQQVRRINRMKRKMCEVEMQLR